MEQKIEFRLASFLFDNAFPVYKILYQKFKEKKDSDEIDFLKQVIKKGDIVLDIGSNIGFYAKIISNLIGETGKVFCFEPDKINFKHLSNLIREKTNVVLINKAVSDKSGKIEIFTSHRINVDHRTYKPEKFESSYFVDAVTIDEYLDINPHVDFIKMDIQGAEIFALKGMKRILSENKNLQILTELWPLALKSAGSSAVELLTYMNEMGYKSFILGKNPVQITPENLNTIVNFENDSYNVIFKR